MKKIEECMKRDLSFGQAAEFGRRQFLRRAGILTGSFLSRSFSPGVVSLGGTQPQQETAAAASALTAFVDVTVVPMDRERLLGHQTVLVRGGRIAEIGPASEIQVPEGSQRIDGRGRYLMPGLADMHVHYTDQEFALLYIANGVMTVRNMGGWPGHFGWRSAVEMGRMFGPTLFTCGPIMQCGSGSLGEWAIWGEVFEVPEDAARSVARQKQVGYDFIKVVNGPSREVYDAIIKAAKQHDIRVVGHVPEAVGVEHALKSGQASIEHLWGYLRWIAADGASLPGSASDETARLRESWGLPYAPYADESKIAAVAEATRAAGTWSCPTLLMERWHWDGAARDASYAGKQAKYLPAYFRALLSDPPPQQFEWASRASELSAKIVKALRDAGARLLLGTDAFPWSIHLELALLVEAGLTPYEAIKAGTYDAAEFLNGLDEFGTVAVGRRADLILVEGNPLQDVANVARRVGVMLRGRWLPDSELQGMVERLAASYVEPVPER